MVPNTKRVSKTKSVDIQVKVRASTQRKFHNIVYNLWKSGLKMLNMGYRKLMVCIQHGWMEKCNL